MELKVWVEGVVRVVCGLSIDTSCQDVVIALAQATGQTGRYILALKLRGSERQLVADERPLQCLSQLGQLATEVQFILRRTGPSLGVGQEDTPTTERRLHRPPEPGPLKHRKPHKSLTFNLGPSAFSHGSQPNKARAASPGASPEPRASPVSLVDATNPVDPSKEEVFGRVLQQQRRLQELELQLHCLQRETHVWEQESCSATAPSPTPVRTEELQELERRLRENEAELVHTARWEAELQAETDREQDLRRRLRQTLSSVDDHSHETEELRARSAHLEHDVRPAAHRRSSRAAARQQQETLRPLRQELRHRLQQGDRLDATVSETQEELRAAGDTLQDRRQLIEELNKELRQCNLQQFIQQTVGPHGDHAAPPPATELYLSVAGVVE
ncbi:ras association domain-containing protein 7-like isoform X1 [Scophthalmus maximus]|nr:ras association domain-containing protein 7-like isoform X1 [Scophthalmus maximus]XP_035483416.1 ras association domain-containing protein 7-like isoform X1 [Scophthalmus maximus]